MKGTNKQDKPRGIEKWDEIEDNIDWDRITREERLWRAGWKRKMWTEWRRKDGPGAEGQVARQAGDMNVSSNNAHPECDQDRKKVASCVQPTFDGLQRRAGASQAGGQVARTHPLKDRVKMAGAKAKEL